MIISTENVLVKCSSRGYEKARECNDDAMIYSVEAVELEVASEDPLSVLLFLLAGTGSTIGVRE